MVYDYNHLQQRTRLMRNEQIVEMKSDPIRHILLY
jgi:hypothetical protein